MPTLLLRLNAPLQSWGGSSLYDNRETDDMPTKSGVLGMIAAALGRKRDESIDDLARLLMGVRIDAPGRRVTDFQITQMGEKLNSNLSRRVYLSDATFLVGIFGQERTWLEELEHALSNPVYAPYLGRRACPPTLPFLLGIRDEELYPALLDEPWQLTPVQQRKVLNRRRTNQEIRLRIVVEEDTNSGALKRDVPVSFSPYGRRYAFRTVREMPGKLIADHNAVSETEHDVFDELR